MAIDPSVFDGTPAGSTPAAAPAPVVASAPGGPSRFDGTPPAVAPAPQKYDEYNAQGQWIGTSEEGFQGPNARPQGGTAQVPPPTDTAAPQSGYLANLAAGGNAAVASGLGLPVDLATGGINLATRGINAVTGADIPKITDPVGGSGTFKRAMGLIGANPDDVTPDGVGQEIARGVGGGLVSAAIPAAGVAGLVRGGVMAAPAAARTLAVLGDATPQNALLGAASGGAGEAAASQVPDEYKPVAGLAGGVLGVGVPLAGIAAGRGLARAAGDYVAPATGRANALLDTAGGVVTGADGTPINMLSGEPMAATPNQVQIAGQRLQAAASDPDAVRTALATQGPPSLNDQPTTAQLTRDPGLLAAERGISRTVPQAQAPFLARAAAQNDARVGAVRGVAEGGDPTALPAALQQQTADADAAAAARVAGVQAQTAGDVAATDAAGQAQVAGLRQAADQTRAGMGGDLPAGSEGQVGAALRAPVKAFDDAARARETAAWEAIDKDGTLAVDMRPIKNGVADIMASRSALEKPMEGEEAGIFDAAKSLDNVHSFRDLVALRSRITNQIRKDRIAGDPVRNLSILLGHVHDAMAGGVVANAEADARAVANGTLAPDQTAVAKFVSERDKWDHEARLSVDPGSAGRDAAGGSGAVSPVGGTPNAGRAGSGDNGGARGLPPSAANEVGAPLPGSSRKPESLVDFLISKGGVRDQTGDLAAMDAQLVHQKGAGRLVNPKGLSLDYAREAAAEAGFIRPNADVNDLLDALGEHLSGNPRYRMSEQEMGDHWGQTHRDAISADDARYDATDRVSAAADDAGIRLTARERDHAAELHMQGVHPDEAIRQAVTATDGDVLDRNAAANAFGSPGVPLAERQSDNGLSGSTRLTANFDQAAAARDVEARRLTAERKGGFDGAPGVKSILQGGPAKGTFKVPDAGVAAAVIRVGPSGADHVRVYLAKGGSPEALSDAAAFSLRRDAMRSDGTLDPAKYATWAKQRSSFLSALPDAAARFGAAADAQRAAETGSAEAAQSLKDAVKAAQQTVDEAVAARAEQTKDVQRSVIGKFLGNADPVTRVASILRSPTAVADMRELAARVANDPEAKAGLQRAVAEHILRDLKGNNAGVGGENFLKGDQLQTFLRTREPALREVLTPGQMASLRNVAESLERSNLSVSGSKMAGGSDSLQIASAGASASPSTFLGQFMRKTGSAITTGGGTLLGSLLGGPVGAGVGFVSGLGVAAAQAGREAGMRTVDDLVANAMLHPQLAAVLLAKVTPNNRESLSRALISQLRRVSLVSSAVGQQDQGRTPKNALLH